MAANRTPASDKECQREGIRPIRLAKSSFRAAVTNGARILPKKIVDGRSLWARRFHDVLALHTQDLGGDGNITEAERAILRRAATLIVELEKLEVSFALGNNAGYLIDRYQRCANTLRRLSSTLGSATEGQGRYTNTE